LDDFVADPGADLALKDVREFVFVRVHMRVDHSAGIDRVLDD
jgi:hypothetical protein